MKQADKNQHDKERTKLRSWKEFKETKIMLILQKTQVEKGEYPALGKECNNCNKKRKKHFASCSKYRKEDKEHNHRIRQ